MKRLTAMMMVLITLCAALSGCSAEKTEDESTAPMETAPSVVVGPRQEPESVSLGDSGAIRVNYTVNRSSVHYVTSASQLPDHEELKQFDDAYFQDNALLLIYETVSSGSVKVGIGSVELEGNTAKVTLDHTHDGSAGTAVMTTWLVWVQVERGLEYEWTVTNPAVESNVSDR